MSVTVVVGSQWGDEAKGKMVDLLCEGADLVARYNGGDNAGHTVVNQYGTFKLRLMPNGIANPKTKCIIGPGVIVNLATLIAEIQFIHEKGLNLNGRFWISPRCHVVMPYHPMIEEIHEKAKGRSKTGTTQRGIGPTYADKVSYNGIRLADFADEAVLREKLAIQLEVKNVIFKAFGMPTLNLEQVIQEKLAQYVQIKDMVGESFGILQAALTEDAHIVLEGAQGALLDNDWGTYPFCTASSTIAGGAAAGLGIAPHWIRRVIGVAKAYTSRVGAGPMPTELLDETGDLLRNEGNEFGTVTGRPRRCGWLDAEIVRFTGQLSGYTDLALTKLDVLDKLPVIKIGIGYRHPDKPGVIQHYWDGDARWLSQCEPEYIEMEGWMQPTVGITDFARLPFQAKVYVEKVEELTGVRVSYVSTGPGRDETIYR